MRKPRDGSGHQSSSRASKFESHEVFTSASDMVAGLDSLVAFLNQHYKKKIKSKDKFCGFIVEGVRVEFSDQTTDTEIRMEYGTNSIVIVAPQEGDEKTRDLKRLKILAEFAPVLPEAQLRNTLLFWLALTPTARRNLTAKSRR